MQIFIRENLAKKKSWKDLNQTGESRKHVSLQKNCKSLQKNYQLLLLPFLGLADTDLILVSLSELKCEENTV